MWIDTNAEEIGYIPMHIDIQILFASCMFTISMHAEPSDYTALGAFHDKLTGSKSQPLRIP